MAKRKRKNVESKRMRVSDGNHSHAGARANPAGGRLARSKSATATRLVLIAALSCASGPAFAADETPDEPPLAETIAAVEAAPATAPTRDPADFWNRDDLDPADFPGAVQNTELRDLWAAGLEAEYDERLEEASNHYIEISRRIPDDPMAYWRVSRNYWRLGDLTPDDRRDEKIRWFKEADRWAALGIEADPECAACMLFRVGALGRLATTEGISSAARNAKTMAELIDRGIALQPTHTDGDYNSTLGNLYYASSNFYRSVPDWRILEWLIGVRGDKERALRDIRKAVEISHQRIDYRVELGATLLCLGTSKKDEERIAEGKQVLGEAQDLELILPSDSKDLALAQVMMREPNKACGFSRDGFIDHEKARKDL